MTIFRASLFLTVLCVGCNTDRMAPLPPAFFVRYPNPVPVILVGQVLATSQAVGPPRRSEWNGRLVQLYVVRVRVEQVLQGDVLAKEADIFDFSYMDAGKSPFARITSSLYTGRSEMVFLQKDFGKLRTICDGWSNCIQWSSHRYPLQFQD